MKEKIAFFICLLLAVPCIAEQISADEGPTAFNNIQAVQYRLIEGSLLVDHCGLSPPDIAPIRGSFLLRPIEDDPLFLHFALRNLRFTGTSFIFEYTGQGEGKYRIGGEFALQHQMTLKVCINEIYDVLFDSGLVVPQMKFPWIEIDLKEFFPDPNEFPLRFFQLRLVAVPWPPMWFSTEHGFHCSNSTSVENSYVSNGDLLSPTGTIVRKNHELTYRLGIMPVVPDLGLDAVLGPMPALSSGGGPSPRKIWFSAEDDAFSETLGELLGDGDLLSDAGWVVRQNADLIKPFSPMPVVVDYGLDAVALGPDGLLLFSTEDDFFSESLGMSIGHGYLLGEDGQIFKRVGELLANFMPIEPIPIRFGLDSAYVWPHGEVWFSTEVGFADGRLGYINDGDLLSDTGRVVARNLELLDVFGPIEDLADFGLDSLHIIWPCPSVDLNSNGRVDMPDYAVFAQYWGKTDCGTCGGADFTGDGGVRLDDLRQFVANWLIGAK